MKQQTQIVVLTQQQESILDKVLLEQPINWELLDEVMHNTIEVLWEVDWPEADELVIAVECMPRKCHKCNSRYWCASKALHEQKPGCKFEVRTCWC